MIDYLTFFLTTHKKTPAPAGEVYAHATGLRLQGVKQALAVIRGNIFMLFLFCLFLYNF